ncbi:Adenylate and Guanylate cyclase catalytic domain containing protein [Tritrichomonas foetus]|uniref:Adenylate and Guanylate cyclase catalytic domain containing protein n=1 Tax=Tritrichomonas foetus TaxID=1144522 RepID=A0A1J4KBH1_9EUKA|nr:Adenylate and Guanylate cyclase catalytic domain containing protein [Tritrichomonas foetus]|eukprot:OHT07038.1 Adenylate and Guanylate cyclase catalytic domain containing protein [Tritrichomonas foetus]
MKQANPRLADRSTSFSNLLSSSNNLQSSSVDSSFASMIEHNYFKKLRNRLFFLFAFVDTIPVNYFELHIVLSYWRLLQYIGAALAVNYPYFWRPNTVFKTTMSIVSIFFHIIPPDSRPESSIIIEFGYFAIITAMFIFLIIYAWYFRRTAKLSNLADDFIVGGINGFFHLFHPILINTIGESIGRLIMGTNHFSVTSEICGILFSFTSLSGYFFFYTWISSVSYVFRPHSLMTIISGPQVAFSALIWSVTFLTGIASQLTFIPRIILTAVTAILYFSGNWIVTFPGSFVSEIHRVAICATSTANGLFMILVAAYDLFNHDAEMIEIFVYIFLVFILSLISAFILQRNRIKMLKLLDNIYETGIDIYQVNNLTENSFLNTAITGLINSHPICTNWSFFKQGAEKYSDSFRVWRIFGKFVAVYPEETNLLSFIIHKMQTNPKMTGYLVQEIISQAQSILTQREESLSYELKLRISKASKQVQVTKRKIRHIWDLAIQSSINEMDSAINNTLYSKKKSIANFTHLLSQYPNNRFVARLYSKFALEILGDPQLHNEWNEKVRLLQRGLMVNPDRTNLLGLQAYPMLPVIQGNTKPDIHYSESEITNDITHYVDLEDGSNTEVNEQIILLQEKIKNLSIPAINCMRIWTIFLYFILILVPTVGMLIYAPSYLNELTTPLDLMYHISYLRALTFQLPLFAQHYLFENIGMPNNETEMFFPKPEFRNQSFDSFGNSMTTKDQLRFFMTEAANSVEKISLYRTFGINNYNLQIVHKIIFDETIPYAFFDENQVKTYINISLQSSIMQIIFQLNDILTGTPNLSWYFSNHIADPIDNAPYVTDASSIALSYCRNYLTENHNDMQNSLFFAMTFICIVYIVIMIGIMIYQIENLRLAKSQIYQCLTALPKNVVSCVAESLKLIEKDEDSYSEEDDDFNKQEENILKVFSSASDITLVGSSERTVYIFLNIFIACCVLAMVILLCEMFPLFSEQLGNNAPHLDYVLGTVAYLMGTMEVLESLAIKLTFVGYDPSSLNNHRAILIRRILNFTDYYHRSRYGTWESNVPPYRNFNYAHENAQIHYECENDTNIPTTFVEYYQCFQLDIQLNMVEPFFINTVMPVYKNASQIIDNRNPFMTNLWIIILRASDYFFYPMFKDIVTNMREIFNETIPSMTTPVIVLLVICFFLSLLIFFQTFITEEKLKFSMSLLHHCPPDIVLQTSKIMAILSGDFSITTKDSVLRQTDFFDSVLKNVPDSVIIVNEQFIVESVNRATERIYGISSDDLVGTHIKSFFNSADGCFSRNIETIFNPDVELLNVEFKTSQNNSYLQLTPLYFKDHIVFITRDQTQNVSYNTLIAEERSKSDSLLASILPKHLISRVQNGEENISFSVQSASICFMDIVEFTPWCAANTASMTMSTLNLMFKYFDSSLAQLSSLTKIKCIGDCYMAAGGIFVEVNQPAVHAKEMIEFGLAAIASVRKINEQLKQTLRIRVGVNTGGPIVAGVLGIDKPTFEILGPAINMAQQMEHHGVPMKVHISRSSYELIYGGTFNVKERGQIEIKNGSVRTYLVAGKGEM